jgi:hypothetical protein
MTATYTFDVSSSSMASAPPAAFIERRLPESNRCTGFCRPTLAIPESRTVAPNPIVCRRKTEPTPPAESRQIPLFQGEFGAHLARTSGGAKRPRHLAANAEQAAKIFAP